ncbi:MAG: hypothetical protein AAF680_00035 [Pseudomonadota bacterium]
MARREEFLSALRLEFPNALAGLSDGLHGLIHLEVAAFRRTVEEAVRDGRFWYVEKSFRLVEEYVDDSGDDVDNALGVSFLEDFALFGFSRAEILEILPRLSRRMQDELRKHGEQWSGKPAT